MTKNKKIYFYKITIADKISTTCKYDVLTLFKRIPNYNDSDPFSYQLIDDIEKTLVEILSISNEYVFGRIGKEDDLNYMHFRSKLKINISKDISVPEDSYAEKFTYFYINLSTGILAYLSILGAPPFSKFKRFINQLCIGKFNSNIVPVCNKDVVNLLKKKDRVSGFIIKTTVPTDEFLGCENLGLDRNSFVELENATEVTIELNLSGKRKVNISNMEGNNNPIFKIIEKIRTSPSKIDTRVKANNKEERTRTYDLDEDFYTYNIDLPEVKDDDKFSKEILNSLITAYNNSIEDILLLAK